MYRDIVDETTKKTWSITVLAGRRRITGAREPINLRHDARMTAQQRPRIGRSRRNIENSPSRS